MTKKLLGKHELGSLLPQEQEYSWWNSTPFDPSHSSVARQEAELVTDMCWHVKDTCPMSGTMSIEFLAKFYPILTPHTPLQLMGMYS